MEWISPLKQQLQKKLNTITACNSLSYSGPPASSMQNVQNAVDDDDDMTKESNNGIGHVQLSQCCPSY